jgi:hypothetical protein
MRGKSDRRLLAGRMTAHASLRRIRGFSVISIPFPAMFVHIPCFVALGTRNKMAGVMGLLGRRPALERQISTNSLYFSLLPGNLRPRNLRT